MVEAIVSGTGTFYTDRTERMYLHLRKGDDHGLPSAAGSKTPITIVARGHTYAGLLNARGGYDYLFVSPDLTDEDGGRHKLAYLFAEWGLAKGGRVRVSVAGTRLTLDLPGGTTSAAQASGSASRGQPPEFALPEEVPAGSGVVEGAVRAVTVNAYERDPKARQQCIDAHGTSCGACGMSFAAEYGPAADGYIHVHHLRPLSEVRTAHAVDPVADLRPVCPNCHAVIHRRTPPYSIEEVRTMWRQRPAEPTVAADGGPKVGRRC